MVSPFDRERNRFPCDLAANIRQRSRRISAFQFSPCQVFHYPAVAGIP
jgi:hypothetical protein